MHIKRGKKKVRKWIFTLHRIAWYAQGSRCSCYQVFVPGWAKGECWTPDEGECWTPDEGGMLMLSIDWRKTINFQVQYLGFMQFATPCICKVYPLIYLVIIIHVLIFEVVSKLICIRAITQNKRHWSETPCQVK